MMLNHVIRPLTTLLAAVCFLGMSFLAQAEDAKSPVPTDDATIAAGKTLFENNCQSCHAVTDEIVVGPGLKGILKRRQLPWLQKWIRNSQQVIASGDPYAVELFNKYNKSVMSSFPSFKDEEIASILSYVVSQENVKAASAAPAAGGSTTSTDSNDGSSKYLNYILTAFIIILVIVLVILVLIISILTKFLKQKDLSEDDKYVVDQSLDFGAVFNSSAFKIALGFLFVAVVGKAAIDGAVSIGIQQGYAPTQPIAFSHKLHAGKYKIDCNYCHTGVNKGKSANIPSANICMNCHNAIKTESPKLVKLRNAWETGKPIEWVRVHNLPDLAYFNHAQHVKVGGIACQTCHGPIEKMEVVQQYSPLTMGWCINCHRETAIKTEGNAYYNKLVLMHQKKSKEPMTVADNGGLECSKCHY